MYSPGKNHQNSIISYVCTQCNKYYSVKVFVTISMLQFIKFGVSPCILFCSVSLVADKFNCVASSNYMATAYVHILAHTYMHTYTYICMYKHKYVDALAAVMLTSILVLMAMVVQLYTLVGIVFYI